MTETLARFTANRQVELVDTRSQVIAPAMTPLEAAFLARGLLAAAAALSGHIAPPAGALAGDAHLPVMTWKTGTNPIGEFVLILSIPPGIEMTFQMPREGAKALGQALIDQSGILPPGLQGGTVH